jgi:prepilin-type processing-associated H-X9-DG protein
MNSSTPESDRDAPQPLDYASPVNQRKGRPRRFLWPSLAFAIFGLICLFLFLTWPHFEGPRPVGHRAMSASNLRQIGQAILLYTNNHQGEYPDSFQTILLNEDITSDVFVSPLRSETPANGPTTQATADQMGAGGHVSYIYLGGRLSVHAVTPNTIVAYEMIPNAGGGTNVLFGDGHVEFVGPATAAKIVSRAASGQFPVAIPADGTWGQ